MILSVEVVDTIALLISLLN